MAYSYDQQIIAKDFSTDKALKDYLQEHPDADKSLHHVVAPKDEEKPHDPREYARERAKFAPPNKKQFWQGTPSVPKVALRIVARYLKGAAV